MRWLQHPGTEKTGISMLFRFGHGLGARFFRGGHADRRVGTPGARRHRAVRKASLVAKLKAARDRKRAAAGKCEGRKSYAEINPEMVHLAKGLRRRKPGNSLRPSLQIWQPRGHVNANGKQFSAASIASMLGA